MQSIWLTFIVCLAFSTQLVAQEPAVKPPNPHERLDEVLKAWETRMAGIDTFSTKITRTQQSALTKRKTTYVGEAAFMKPNMGRIELTHEDEIGKKDAEKIMWERVICDGKHLYEYSPKDKRVIVFNLDDLRREAQIEREGFIGKLRVGLIRLFVDNWMLAILKGMPVDKLKERFNVELFKESEWYLYLSITPKTKDDAEEFTTVQLTLWAKNPNSKEQPDLTMLPCRFWFRQPSGKETTYSFENMQPNVKLTPKAFAPERIEGYELKETTPASASSPNR